MCSVQHLIKAVGALGSRAVRGALPARPGGAALFPSLREARCEESVSGRHPRLRNYNFSRKLV